MSDFAFRIIADTKAYQAELMKIPGATEKSAFSAAQRLVMALERGGREAGQKAGKEAAAGLKETGIPAVSAAAQSVAEAMRAAMSAGTSQMAATEAARKQLAVNEAMRASMAAGVQVQERATAATLAHAAASKVDATASTVAARSMGAVRAGYVSLANQASDVLTQLVGGTSLTTILVQQGPQVAGALDMMGVSMARMLAVAGPLGAALGLGAIAYSRYASEVAAAELAQKQAQETTQEELRIQKALTDAVIKNAILTGRMTEEEGIAYEAAGKAADLYAVRKAALVDRINEEQAALKAAESARFRQTDAVEADVDAQTRSYRARGAAADVTREAEQAVKDHTAKLAEYGRELGTLTEREQRYGRLLAENEELQKDSGKADDARRKAAEELAAALAVIVRGYDQWAQAVKALEDMEQRATASQLTGIEAVEAARVESIRRAEELATEADKGAGASAERRAETERQLAETIVAINEEAAAKKAKIREDEAKAAEKEAERIRALQYAAADRALSEVTALTEQAYSQRLAAADRTNQSIRDGYGELTRAETEQLQRRLQGQRRAALAWWVANKATALAQGVVNTQLAVSNALASAPPPFNAALAVAAGIAGAAQVAQIAAAPPPSFHRGTQGASSRRDEFAATLERGEAVIPKSAAQDPRNQDAIARMRGDRMSAGPTVVAVDRYDGRAFGRGIRDQLRAGGYLRRAIASTNPHLGHR